MTHALEAAARQLRSAQNILLTSGAGLSAAAGFDYGDTERFKELFPAFAARGMSARYQAIGFRGWTPADHWAYWAIHVADIRFGARRDPVYRELLRLTSHANTFVMTSNVDRLFTRNGFDKHRFFSPQGDYGLLQCRRACRDEAWDSEPVVRGLLAAVDPLAQTVRDPRAVPACPSCGGEVFFNVRLDRHFVESPYREQQARLAAWLRARQNAPLVVLEIGAGFNTPGVIRWPGEQLVAAMPQATLIRVNPDHPQVPPELGERAIGLRTKADQFIGQLASAIG